MSGLRRVRTLQNRFLAINLPLVLLTVALLFGLFEYNAYSRSMMELRHKLDRIVESQSAILSESVSNRDAERINLILAAAAADPDITGAAVYDDMANFLGAVGQTLPPDTHALTRETKILYSAGARQEVIGRLVVSVTDERVNTMISQRALLAGILAGLIVLSVVVSALVANRWTIGIPLSRLLHSIDRTESGRARLPVHWDSNDEVGAVVTAFNRMQDRQKRYEDELRKARDQLERRVAERTAELARARDAAEAANRAKTGFLANMSHELRTPLNAVIGFAEVLEGEILGKLGDPRYREYAVNIRESGTHLLALINDLLDLSKAEAGKLELKETILDLADATATAIAMVQPRAEEAGVAVVNELDANAPHLRADDRKIKQILLNLLTNAVKFTPEGGQVVVRLENTEAGVELAIEDTGIGISEDDLARVMQPFAQVDSALNRKYNGTGLGLPLVKSLVELHSGELEIESALKRGTRVVVHLPRERVHAEHGSASGRPATGQTGDAVSAKSSHSSRGSVARAAPSQTARA